MPEARLFLPNRIMSSTRVANVTGAAGDKVISLRLADDGLDSAVNDLPNRKDEVDALVDQVSGKGCKSIVLSEMYL